MGERRCRNCRSALGRIVLDLGDQPLANAYPDPYQPADHEARYPLRVAVCESCWLMQLEHDVDPACIFDAEYAYFSSVSDSWVAHAEAYAEKMIDELGLDETSLVVEVASNDGYLLKAFAGRGVPVLGIEPTANTAAEAEAKGVPTRVTFFGSACAEDLLDDGIRPDLVVGNNVLAHVSDLDDFVRGLATLVGPTALLTMEFPHLLRLIEGREFDTIYHEHYSYFSLLAVRDVFARRGLDIVDVEQIPTHGGSLRIYARRAGTAVVDDRVTRLVADERDAGLDTLAAYEDFSLDVNLVRDELVAFLHRARDNGSLVVGYGAPAKGNTLLNFCGVTPEILPFTVDRSRVKQGRLLPGTHIPIEAPQQLLDARPDYVLVLPWNILDEITAQMVGVREWGGRFVVPIPRLQVVP